MTDSPVNSDLLEAQRAMDESTRVRRILLNAGERFRALGLSPVQIATDMMATATDILLSGLPPAEVASFLETWAATFRRGITEESEQAAQRPN